MKRQLLILGTTLALTAIPVASIAAQKSATGSSGSTGETTQAAEVNLFPIPDYGGGFSHRAALTGDWGDQRNALAQDGVQFSLDVTLAYQGVDGGIDNDDDSQGTADYRLLLDTGKAGLWARGFLELHAESYWGTSINKAVGAVSPVNLSPLMSAPAGNGTYLSHVVYTQFLTDRFALTGGKINTAVGDTNDFAHGLGREAFMNGAFGLNPVTYYASPYAPLGGGFIYLGGDEKQHEFSVMAWDTDAVIDDVDFRSLFEGNTSYAAALRSRTNFFNQQGHQWFGLIYGDGTFDSLVQDGRLPIAGPLTQPAPGGTPADIIPEENTTEDSTWAFFYNFDQTLVEDPADPERGWGLFGRFGVADDKTNAVHQFYSIGLGGHRLFPSRPRDRFGIGYYYLKLSDEVDLIPTEDDEQGLEMFYTVAVLPSVDITADLQVIDGAALRADTAVVAAIRMQFRF